MLSASRKAKGNRANALAALKARREGGGGRSPHASKAESADSDDDIYDEVSEDEYKSIVRGRIMQDDFIEDDDGSGYVDDGRYEWEDGRVDEDDDTEDEAEYYQRTGRRKPKKKRDDAGKTAKAGPGRKRDAASAADYSFARSGRSTLAKPDPSSSMANTLGAAPPRRHLSDARGGNLVDPYRPSMPREKEDDFMKRLMGGLESGAEPASPSPATRYESSRAAPSLYAGGASAASAARKRKSDVDRYDGSFSSFRRSALLADASSPSSGEPSSDPADPPSDDIVAPRVHVTGTDTPPWGSRHGLDDEGCLDFGLGGGKRLKAAAATTGLGGGSLPMRIGSMGLEGVAAAGAAPDDSDVFLAAANVRAPHVAASAVKHEVISDDEDDFSIRAPKRGVTNRPGVTQRATAVKAAPAAATPAKPAANPARAPSPTATSHVNKRAQQLNTSWRAVEASIANVTSAPVPETPLTVPPRAGTKAAAAALAAQTTSSPSGGGSRVDALEPDGRSVRLFWLDYYEHEGTIYLTGKVKDRATGRFVSACLAVGGIERCVYLLPRAKIEVNGHATDKVPGEEDVYDEFDSLRSKHGISGFLGKWVSRKYAFEIPGVPEESEYLKVRYGFDEPALPTDLSGNTFSRIFGANTSAFELFVVKRRIMGPCWLDVKEVTLRTEGAPLSWCKLELAVDDPKCVSPCSDEDATAPKEPPPLTVLSLSARTIVNHKDNKREIVCAAARTWTDVNLEDPTPPEQLKSSLFSVVRPLGTAFPPNFERAARESGGTRIVTAKYERLLLNQLLAQISLQDPDVIVGHEFVGVTLDVLLHRMRDLKADHWSRIGRYRRAKWPSSLKFNNVNLLAGRLVCDLASDTAKGMIPSTTWSLTEMCGTHLKVQREDIDPDETASFFDTLAPIPDRLLSFVRHCEVDAFLQMSLASKVQILPLTKQLTNLAGHSWGRTLNAGRAERNEYILLHDFHRQKFICPDKMRFNDRKAARLKAEAEAEGGGGGAGGDGEDGARKAGGAGSSKKDKFKGGLVFDPKRGLYDKYILVMDFNSLYPSIIQEFNIDFTTVDRTICNEHPDEMDRIPELPSSDVKQGVLPRLIATLVNRRRQVKSLMKDRSAPATKQLQWNIKQLALKLTANSMYGCLGFEGSRFYARPLAALTTYKGREILTATKELAESLSLEVIYGDTDSVMINTNTTDLAEANRIGNDFKRAVNEKYRLLEIDIDGIFERMLLLQKKKYAALKVEDDGKRSTEIKGLDMKRREYSALSKNVSNYVLSQILSGEATETVVAKIHDYLHAVGGEVREGKVPLEDFIIYKKLSKNPEEYADAKSFPHVQVALRMKEKGTSARMGDVIPYVFCLGDDGEASVKSAQAQRARHPDEVRKKESGHRVDFEYYLSLQILPPVERLCDSIEGTDRVRLAECLGLDVSRYQTHAAAGEGSAHFGGGVRDFAPLESQIPDEIRYAKCEPLELRCVSCGETSRFEGLLAAAKTHATAAMAVAAGREAPPTATVLTPHGLVCTKAECGKPLSRAHVAIQLEQAVRSYIDAYYEGWSVCTDPTCGVRTRMAGVYAKRCLVPGCRGATEPAVSDKALYTQLCYYASLVDAERAKEHLHDKAQAASSSSASAAAAAKPGATGATPLLGAPTMAKRAEEALLSLLRGADNDETLATLLRVCDKYLQRSGRRYVGLDRLFGWMKVR